MAAFKFFNIGKANEEITRLETELEAAKAESKTAKEHAETVEKNAEGLSAELAQAKSDLSTAKTSIESLTARAEKAEADLKVASDKLANPGEQITAAASRKALEIIQAQGIPAIPAGASATPSNDVIAQYEAISNPADKVAFYRKNKAAIDKAWSTSAPKTPKQ